ncbi:hypothetical protein BDF20DRAFT_807872, partial [Mycotypha africana]|uniref:uncharacterized protein n=1 Tax=Mycotypha africana TaxID=64632 RepID=UPI0023007B9A
KDCNEMGHFNKSCPKCKYYKAASVDNGNRNKKRRQSESVKAEKKAVKKKKTASQAVECPSCGNDNHASSRSPLCPNHIQSKEEAISFVLGHNSIIFVRKLPVCRAVLPQFREEFKEKVILCCKDIRAIVFRCQLFVNAYLVHNKNDIPSVVFTQQFWYSIAQLVTGYSHCLTEAAKEISISYTNTIVELFEKRMLKYLTYKLQNIVVGLL